MDSLKEILDLTRSHLERFIAYPNDYASTAHALWCAHTHRMDEWYNTPRLAFLSPEPASGKSRALEVTAALVPFPVPAINVTSAYLFRKISEDDKPTILYDEIDTVFGPKARENEELRGLINAGYRRGAVAGRCETQGKNIVCVDYDAFGAVAMAGLGFLPPTILSRSVIINMKKRSPTEIIEPYRPRLNEPDGHIIRDKLSAVMSPIDYSEFPELPDIVIDRHADVWECLIQIGDSAGEEWGELARSVACSFITASEDSDNEVSLGVILLRDLRTVWNEQFGKDAKSVFARDLIEALKNLDEAPWNSIKGEPITTRMLSFYLGNYDIRTMTVRCSGIAGRGYRYVDMYDAWNRYLPPLVTDKPIPDNVTPINTCDCNGEGCPECGDYKTTEGEYLQ